MFDHIEIVLINSLSFVMDAYWEKKTKFFRHQMTVREREKKKGEIDQVYIKEIDCRM